MFNSGSANIKRIKYISLELDKNTMWVRIRLGWKEKPGYKCPFVKISFILGYQFSNFKITSSCQIGCVDEYLRILQDKSFIARYVVGEIGFALLLLLLLLGIFEISWWRRELLLNIVEGTPCWVKAVLYSQISRYYYCTS